MIAAGEARRPLALERRIALAELLRENPVLTVEDLAHRFSVSPQTVRRDLQYLQRQGLVTRTHGGAVARHKDVLSPERSFPVREFERAEEKRAIAARALPLVEAESTVIMDASTTVLYLARAVPADIELSVIVNALPIAMELSSRPNLTLTMLGGTVRRTSYSFTGPIAEAALHRVFADTLFMSVRGLSLLRGLTEANPYESALKEIMVANAARVVALVDSSKLEQMAFSLFAPVTAIDVLVTDEGADPKLVDGLREAGLQVEIAEVAPA